MSAPAFAHSSGPRTAKLAFIGEAWGKQEAIVGKPFVGSSGQEFTRLLTEAGISRADCFLTNVLAFQPPNNRIEELCAKKSELGPGYKWPPISQGKYLRPEYLGEIDRLREEMAVVAPNLTVCLGNTAAWGVLRQTGIGRIRGAIFQSHLNSGHKVLPTYHPANILRDWSNRVVLVADLLKAKREADFPEVRRPKRFILVNPTLSEAVAWTAQTLAGSWPWLAVDTETTAGQITHIGFARSPTEAMVIPFTDWNKPDRSYWLTKEEEVQAWELVKALLDSSIPKVFQNATYDLQYLIRMGFRPANVAHDTMLLHHALFPELPKGLGFLGSIYTNESAWKLMRKGETTKREE